MISSPYTAENWPIAAAMLPFGNKDSHGGAIHDAEPEEWAKQLRLVRRIGFTEVDPTDTWVRVGDLSPERLADFKSVLSDVGLTIPAISTSRRSVMDPEHGEEYLAYSHRLLDVAAELGVPLVSFGFFQALTAEQQRVLWFWLADGWHDDEAPEVRSRAASLIRELAEHAAKNGQQITLEMYEDTYVGTCDGAVKFLKEVGHDACGLNPDIANFIRLHRPIEPVQDMLDKVLPYAKVLAREELPARRGPDDRPGDDLPSADGVWLDQLPCRHKPGPRARLPRCLPVRALRQRCDHRDRQEPRLYPGYPRHLDRLSEGAKIVAVI